ncbi:phosphatidate cytidylyltransferase [Ancylobacter terrae]|uniref:phosphatidate cytidylyltransferase n=1 Tax=Ancylobacter sp. sgz301288 TaxID=3342077 RepID=UPI00385FE94D
MTLGADFLPRLLSALVLIPLALGVLWFGGWPFAVFWAVAAILVLWEWTAMSAVAPRLPVLAIGGAALLTVATALGLGAVPMAFAAAALGLAATGLAAQQGRGWAAGGFLYAAAALAAPVMLRLADGLGLVAVLWLFALVWTTDIAAYFSGRLIGGPRLWVRISPKKTWSGAIGGTVLGTLAALLLLRAAGIAPSLPLAAVSLGASLLSQAGDLFESAMKRRFGVKDSSGLIPGHGGLMDRLDGFIVAAAFALAVGMARDPSAPAQGVLLW